MSESEPQANCSKYNFGYLRLNANLCRVVWQTLPTIAAGCSRDRRRRLLFGAATGAARPPVKYGLKYAAQVPPQRSLAYTDSW